MTISYSHGRRRLTWALEAGSQPLGSHSRGPGVSQWRRATKEYGSSWIFEPCLTWANALRRVQHPGFSLVASPSASTRRGWRQLQPNSPARSSRLVRSRSMPHLSEADEAFIRQTVATFMADHRVPGVSVALTDHG